MHPPAYFDSVRKNALDRWNQWEDPETGAPTRVLFNQIQIPEHVLSELLQNADDAGATYACASLANQKFSFFHDGADFDEEQFWSLCRFGFSNKRTLHTIGFRGIGFKSTFSLGDTVYVRTPSLSVAFKEDRFTLPEWVETPGTVDGTCIWVPNVYSSVEEALKQSFDWWAKEPFSLLFFRNIRKLSLPSGDVSWKPEPKATVGDAKWFRADRVQDPVLLCRSKDEPFPPECIEEIRKERNLRESELQNFPPCSIDLVVGAPGKLYVILPTGVELDLGFGVNAPFIQDPGRFAIKSPSTSPTNRWLLERAGKFAAETMLAWLADDSLSLTDRADAYALMPARHEERGTTKDDCLAIISEAFWNRLSGQPCVLTSSGTLVEPLDAALLPPGLQGVWSDEDLARVCGVEQFHAVAWEVKGQYRKMLQSCAHVKTIGIEHAIDRLKIVSPPKPATVDRIEKLWLAAVKRIEWFYDASGYHLVPLENEPNLATAKEASWSPDRPKNLEPAVWDRLLEDCPRLCPRWIEHLNELEKQQDADEKTKDKHSRLASLLSRLKLNERTKPVDLLQLACQKAAEQGRGPDHWKWLAEVHAALDLKASTSLRYEVRDGQIVGIENPASRPLFDTSGMLEEIVPEAFLNQRTLSDCYYQAEILAQDAWLEWLASSKSGLASWIQPTRIEKTFSYHWNFEKALPNGLSVRDDGYPYKKSTSYRQQYGYIDHQFEPFEGQTEEQFDEFLQWNIAQLARSGSTEWKDLREVKGWQTSKSGEYCRHVSFNGDASATWIRQLQSMACLPDTKGNYRMPHELYLRTEATRALLDCEPFVAEELDTDASRELLQTLGVRNSIANVTPILNRLVMLAKASEPPLEVLEKLYRQIDSALPYLAGDDGQPSVAKEAVFEAFRSQSLIFTQSHGWMRADDVFIRPGKFDIPGMPVIEPSVAGLYLWTRLGVRPEPSWENVLEWAASLPKGSELDQPTLKRLHTCLQHDPDAMWERVGWLNLRGELVDRESLEYALHPDSFKAQAISHGFRRRTADFTVAVPKKAELPNLEHVAQHRVDVGHLQEASRDLPKWLQTVAGKMTCFKSEQADKQANVRKLARALLSTVWQPCRFIQSMPYLEDLPLLNEAHSLKVHWDADDGVLHVVPLDEADEADELAKTLARDFQVEKLEKALAYCYNRNEQNVLSCLNKHFAFEDAPSEEPDDPIQDAVADGQAPLERDAAPTDNADPDARTVPAAPRPPRGVTNVRQHQRNLPNGLLEDYAIQNGFSADGSNCFFKEPNQILLGVDSSEYPWEYWMDGQIVRRIFPIQAPIGSPKLELTYEQVEMMKNQPRICALLVLDEDRRPKLVDGQWLLNEMQSGSLELKTARYRLVLRLGSSIR